MGLKFMYCESPLESLLNMLLRLYFMLMLICWICSHLGSISVTTVYTNSTSAMLAANWDLLMKTPLKRYYIVAPYHSSFGYLANLSVLSTCKLHSTFYLSEGLPLFCLKLRSFLSSNMCCKASPRW